MQSPEPSESPVRELEPPGVQCVCYLHSGKKPMWQFRSCMSDGEAEPVAHISWSTPCLAGTPCFGQGIMKASRHLQK